MPLTLPDDCFAVALDFIDGLIVDLDVVSGECR
jgi:hypothetical protein